MKHKAGLIFLVLFALLLAACSAASDLLSKDDPIQPGDKIGDILITTAEPGEATFGWDLDCVKQGSGENYACKSEVGAPVNVSMGVYDETLSGKLDSLWSDQIYEMWIDDRPVDLEAFGPIDLMHPRAGPMRAWNVVLVASEPGEITTRDKGVVDSDPFEETSTFIFSAP